MIRSLWLIIATMAIANLMIILIGLGWLFTTGRIDASRLAATRDLYAPTVEQARVTRDQQDAERNRNIEELVAMGFQEDVPLDAETAAEILERFDYTQRERYARDAADIEVLRGAIQADVDRLERARRDFDEERLIFERRRQEITERERSEQFQKTVRLYALAKPDTAREMLQSIINQGDTDQAVAYLDALKPDVTAKIIEKFRENDPMLAADLLERIRIYGTETAVAEANTDP